MLFVSNLRQFNNVFLKLINKKTNIIVKIQNNIIYCFFNIYKLLSDYTFIAIHFLE